VIRLPLLEKMSAMQKYLAEKYGAGQFVRARGAVAQVFAPPFLIAYRMLFAAGKLAHAAPAAAKKKIRPRAPKNATVCHPPPSPFISNFRPIFPVPFSVIPSDAQPSIPSLP
jgi:hypothetical protein